MEQTELKKIFEHTLRMFIIITIFSFLMGVGYRVVMGDFMARFPAWLEETLTFRNLGIKLLISFAFGIYQVKSQKS